MPLIGHATGNRNRDAAGKPQSPCYRETAIATLPGNRNMDASGKSPPWADWDTGNRESSHERDGW